MLRVETVFRPRGASSLSPVSASHKTTLSDICPGSHYHSNVSKRESVGQRGLVIPVSHGFAPSYAPSPGETSLTHL
jgi:hypothetical protein